MRTWLRRTCRIFFVGVLLLILAGTLISQYWEVRLQLWVVSLQTFPEGVMLERSFVHRFDAKLSHQQEMLSLSNLVAPPIVHLHADWRLGVPWWLCLIIWLPLAIVFWFLTRPRKRQLGAFPVTPAN